MESKNTQEDQILYLIESSIKKGNTGLLKFVSTLLSNLKKIIPIENLKDLVKTRLSKKNIYFVRHAESLHNVLESKYKYEDIDKWNVRDPKLTEKGVEQTNNYTIKKLQEKKIKFGAVFVSPLSRTIQTYILLKKALNDDAEIIITDLAKEVVHYSLDKNKGKTLSELKEEYKNEKLNFSYMTKEYWWYDSGIDEKKGVEGKRMFSLRLNLFALWLAFRKEENILIISHSHVYINMQDSFGIKNADIAQMNNNMLFDRIEYLLDVYDEGIYDDYS